VSARDIIVVVPPGSRVRYMEHELIDDQMFVIDASKIATIESDSLFNPSAFIGLPVYDAESYTSDD
jgi:hypothetical protein